uniref:KAT8 regulatory NSL complex subunit 3 n=2 Tax=Cacopsylla melanoneura TaxID=428564 RepID=A0A8D8WWN9_9HEMI
MMKSARQRKPSPKAPVAPVSHKAIVSSQVVKKDEPEEPEVNDGDFELIRKIRSIAGLGYDPLHGEHAYNRYKGASDLSVPLPTRKLFYVYDTESSDPVRDDEEIDIDTVEEEEPLVDTATANRLLDECEKLIEIYRPRNPDKVELEDTWEENIPKSNWSPGHYKSFSQLIHVLNLDHLSRLSNVGHSSEAILRRVTIEQTGGRLRKLFTSIGWNLKMAQWLHGLLVDKAPVKVLVCYLEAMQVLYAKIPTLVNQVINPSAASLASKNLGLDIITQIITKKSWDPVAPMLSQHKMPKLPLAPVFIVLGSEPLHDLPHNSRTHHWISLFTELGSVIPITSLQTEHDKARMKIATYLDELLYTVRYRVHQTRSEFESAKRPIILVGVNAGSALMCHAALYETVAGVVCLGFSVDTAEGRRGRQGDRLLDVKCPVLFVMGQCATTASEQDLNELRRRMKCISGLIVVGGADDQMRKSKLDLMQERVNQNIVDRAVINEIGSWLSKALTMPKPTLPPRVPVQPPPTTVSLDETTPAPVVSIKNPLTKEERAAARREAKEKGVKRNYYQERKRKMAEMKANNMEISPKKQKLFPAATNSKQTPQLLMVSTAPTILRTSALTTSSKSKKSDSSSRKGATTMTPLSFPSPTGVPVNGSVPQITLVASPAKSSLSPSQPSLPPPPPPVPMSPLTRIVPQKSPQQVASKIIGKVPKIPTSTNSHILPKLASIQTTGQTQGVTIVPKPPASVQQQQIHQTLLQQRKLTPHQQKPKTPSKPSTAPSSSTTSSSVPSTSFVTPTKSDIPSTSKSTPSGGNIISLQSLLKNHTSCKPVPAKVNTPGKPVPTNHVKKAVVDSPQPGEGQVTTGTASPAKQQNFRVIGKDNRPRTFNISSLSNVKFLTTGGATVSQATSPVSKPRLSVTMAPPPTTTTSSKPRLSVSMAPPPTATTSSNLLRDLTPAQLLDAPIQFVGDEDDAVIPIDIDIDSPPLVNSPKKQTVKLIRINKAGINISSGATTPQFTKIYKPQQQGVQKFQ